jgi:ATP-dependent helicase HepA
LLEFNSQNKKLSEELLAESMEMDSNAELLCFAFKMLECLGIDIQKGIYPSSFVLKGEPEQPEHATLLGAKNSRSAENGEISESDGCSITVICNRAEALSYENIEFFHWEHPIMRRLFDKALSDDFGALASCLCELVPQGEFWIQYNFVLDFSINSRLGINHLMSEHFLSVIMDGMGNLKSNLQEIENCELKNFKADIPDAIMEYFASEGLERAKNSLGAAVKKISEETEKLAISTLESELHRLEETYMLLRDFELGRILDKKKKDIMACKKNLESPKLRLNGLRVLFGGN